MTYAQPTWDDSLRSVVNTRWREDLAAADRLLARIRAMISRPESADLPSVLREYARGVGAQTDVTRFRLREFCDALARAVGLFGADGGFFDSNWMLRRDVAEAACPGSCQEPAPLTQQ